MKSFKGYLKEGVAWQQSASKMIFDFGEKYAIKIPVSSVILDKIFPNKIRTTAFHVTDIKGGENLIKLQNGKKSVSAFFFMDTSYLMQGIKSNNGGTIAELDGNVIVSAASDIMSMPDKQGRRWIELVSFSQYDPKIENDVVDVIDELADKYNWHEGEYDDFGYDGDSFGKYWQLQELLDNKSKSLLIKDYIDGMTKALKKNKKAVETALREYSNKRVTKRSWDEQLVDQFTIQKIHFLTTAGGGLGGIKSVFKAILDKKKIPYKDWDIDYAGLSTYIRQVGEAEMRTMGKK